MEGENERKWKHVLNQRRTILTEVTEKNTEYDSTKLQRLKAED
jgi:hypothetical protein